MILGIADKVALVIGASKGLGWAVARGLRSEGCKVIGVARSAVEGIDYSLRLDLMQPGATEQLVEEIKRIGAGEPEIIYHCLGGSWHNIKAWATPWSEWSEVYRFNLGVAHDINCALVPAMLSRGWGRVIMTSSDCTKCNSGSPPYASSKFALEGYVSTVSKLWSKRGVVLSAIAPGNFYTPGLWMYRDDHPEWTEEYFKHHLPPERWATADEIARAVVMLCGKSADWMPGAIVRADGGSR